MHVGRDGRLPVARYTEEAPAIVSPAYFMFEIIDENEIEPEYLMLCFRRPDFDRMCWFRTDASVRGGITWEDVCALTIPVPSLPMQRKIVRDYQVITNRITLLQRMNKCYLETIEAVFKAWIIEFSFVNTQEYINSPFGEIPAGWKYKTLGELCTIVTKGTTPTTFGMDFTDSGINFIKGESINDDHSFNEALFAYIDEETDDLLKRSRIKVKDILFTIAGTLGKFAMADESMLPANTNQAVAIIRVNKKEFSPDILYSYFIGGWQTEFYKRNTQQAVQANLSLGTIKDLPILIPDDDSLMQYSNSVMPLLSAVWQNHKETKCLRLLQAQVVNTLATT